MEEARPRMNSSGSGDPSSPVRQPKINIAPWLFGLESCKAASHELHKLLEEIMLIRSEIALHSQQPGSDEEEQKQSSSLPVLYGKFIDEVTKLEHDGEEMLPEGAGDRFRRLDECCVSEANKLLLELKKMKLQA